MSVPSNLDFFPNEKIPESKKYQQLNLDEKPIEDSEIISEIVLPQFFEQEIKHFFAQYLTGAITMEEFVSIKNNPSKFVSRYHNELNPEKKMAAVIKQSFKSVLQRKKDQKQIQNLKGKNEVSKKESDPKDYFQNVINKVKYETALQGMSPNHKRSSKIEDYRSQVRERIFKLRDFMKDKRRDRLTQGSSVSGMKIYELVMALANQTLKKIERNNLIDYFDINKELGKSKLKKYSTFSIKSRINNPNEHKLESDFDDLDKHTQMIRLEKILDQIDKGGSSYVDSIK